MNSYQAEEKRIPVKISYSSTLIHKSFHYPNTITKEQSDTFTHYLNTHMDEWTIRTVRQKHK